MADSMSQEKQDFLRPSYKPLAIAPVSCHEPYALIPTRSALRLAQGVPSLSRDASRGTHFHSLTPFSLNLSLPYHRAELGTRASLSSTLRTNDSVDLESEIDAGGAD